MVEDISQEQNVADTRVTEIELLNVGFINDSTLSQDGDAFDPSADIIERTKTEYLEVADNYVAEWSTVEHLLVKPEDVADSD